MLHQIILVFLLLYSTCLWSQVGVGTSTPDSSSILDIRSTEKGVLLPRLTTTERLAISSPSDGLLLFDSDMDMFFFAIEGKWFALNPWKTEHTSSSPMTVFDSSHGNVGIGTSAPEERLHIQGNLSAGGFRFENAEDLDGNSDFKGSLDSNYLSFGDTSSKAYIAYESNAFYMEASDSSSSASFSVEGHVKAESFAGKGMVEKGTIIMWSGTIIPYGWALCNGTLNNGYRTPDLRSRFVVGYDPSNVDYDQPGNLSALGTTPGDQGGDSTLILSASQMPLHNHSVFLNSSTDGEHRHKWQGLYDKVDDGTDLYMWTENENLSDPEEYGGDFAGSHFHTVNGSTGLKGAGNPIENRPAYYVLAFIMRVK